MKQLACLVILVLASVPASGQGGKSTAAPDKPLSNDDVLAMVSAGVGANTVIAAIEHAPAEALDTAAAALDQLTRQGVCKAVVDAMVKRAAQRGTAALSTKETQAQPAAAKTKTRVFVAGTGTAPFLQGLLDDLMDFLAVKKVPAKQIQGETQSRSNYLERVSSSGGEYLLYVMLDLSPDQPWLSLKAQCFEAQGKMIWEERVKTLNISAGSGAANSLLKKLEKSLEPHIGKPGLPTEE